MSYSNSHEESGRVVVYSREDSRSIAINRIRYRGESKYQQYVFAFLGYDPDYGGICHIAPLNCAETPTDLCEAMLLPGQLVFAKGVLTSRALCFELEPNAANSEARLEDLILRSFGSKQMEDQGEFCNAKLYAGDVLISGGKTITELLRMHDLFVVMNQ